MFFKRLIINAFCIAIAVTIGNAQEQACTCQEDFEALVDKLETNYIAYHLEIKNKREREYQQVLQQARNALKTVNSTQTCVKVLEDFIDWFDDGHLFLLENPKYTETELAQFARQMPAIDLTREAAIQYFDDHQNKLAPIEGIWYATDFEVAVVPDENGSKKDFVAIMLSTKWGNWQPGQVLARFRQIKPDEYEIELRMENHAMRHLQGELYKARIYKGTHLRIPPFTWGKKYPLEPHQTGLMHPEDPKMPTFKRLADQVAVLSIPSHSPEYKPTLDSLIQLHHDDIVQLETLILDIRGNGGGSSGTTNGLLPYLYTEKQKPGIENEGVPSVIASDDNYRYFEYWKSFYEKEEDIPKWLHNLLDRIENNKGKVIPFILEDEEQERLPRPEQVYQSPENIAILMDNGVLSAGEAFVLQAMKSSKVTLFGENTLGVIDYQNVRILRLACEKKGLMIGYPMIASSDLLPKGGINKNGIPPDIKISKKITAPFTFIIDYYEKKK